MRRWQILCDAWCLVSSILLQLSCRNVLDRATADSMEFVHSLLYGHIFDFAWCNRPIGMHCMSCGHVPAHHWRKFLSSLHRLSHGHVLDGRRCGVDQLLRKLLCGQILFYDWGELCCLLLRVSQGYIPESGQPTVPRYLSKCLRKLPSWLLLNNARGVVLQLMRTVPSGNLCITTSTRFGRRLQQMS